MLSRILTVINIVAKTEMLPRSFSSYTDKLVDVRTNENTGISTLKFQRPPVNGLNLELLQQMSRAFDELEKNKCKGLIITSDNPNVFSGGLDLMEIYNPNPDRFRVFWTSLQGAWMKLYASSFPTIAVINGHAPGSGCLLALGCEYRIMLGSKFTIGLNETKFGVNAPKWYERCMLNVIGVRQTELALTSGKLFTANEALKIGLIDEIVNSKEEELARAELFFGNFKGISAYARKLSKLSVRGDIINWMVKNEESNTKNMLEYAMQPQIQKRLELYIESLKNK